MLQSPHRGWGFLNRARFLNLALAEGAGHGGWHRMGLVQDPGFQDTV